MSTYMLKRSCRLIDERKNKLDVEYFLIEEFSLKEQCKTYGIKVETRDVRSVMYRLNRMRLYTYWKKWPITKSPPLRQEMLLRIWRCSGRLTEFTLLFCR